MENYRLYFSFIKFDVYLFPCKIASFIFRDVLYFSKTYIFVVMPFTIAIALLTFLISHLPLVFFNL